MITDYYRVNSDNVVYYDFTQAPPGLVPRAGGIVATCKKCGQLGEVRATGEKRRIAIHHAHAVPHVTKKGEFTFKIDQACKWDEDPPAKAHAGLFGGKGDQGLFRKGSRYG